MSLIPHLTFDGHCEEAFKFYEKNLGGKIEFMGKYEGSPAEGQVPANWRGKIVHATISIDGQPVMGVDAPPDHFKKPQGFSLSIDAQDPKDAERLFNALSAGGSVQMPLQKTFWASAFGMLTDRFGIPWMINCGHEAKTGEK
jgi:PhnB protein